MSKICAIIPIFPTILLVTIIFLICGDGIIYKVSVLTESRKEIIFSSALITRITQGQIESTLVEESLHSQHENKDDDKNETSDSLVVPFNLSREARVDWFKKNLPEFRILQSNNSTRRFDDRLTKFLNRECEMQFFMTWIFPARSFGGRELLAVESVFKFHPYGCLTILSRTMDSKRGHKILKPLLDHGFKILAITPDLPSLFNDTPVEAWFDEMKSGNKDPGRIPLAQNLSNLMRLAILFKYGGVYLDTDFIVLKSFSGLKNAIGIQSIDPVSKSGTVLNNAVLVFDTNHPLVKKFLENFASHFDGNRWGHNGPFLVSRVVAKIRNKARIDYNLTILKPEAFYPIDWNKIGELFKKPENEADANWANSILAKLKYEAYGLHLWNKHSKNYIIQKGSVIERLVQDHCIVCNPINSS